MSPRPEDRVSEPPWAWVVLALSFVALFAALGVRTSFGAFVTAWEGTFGVGRSAISVISSLSLMVYGLGMPVIGRLADRFGARAVLAWSFVLMGLGLFGCYFAGSVAQLAFFYGVVASVGFCGASSVTVSVAVLKWFPTRRGIAMGVTSCGIAAGAMLVGPLSLYLIRSIGWRPTLLLYGLICLVPLTAVIWLLYREPPPGYGASPAATRGTGAAALPVSPASVSLWLGVMIVVTYFVCGFTDLGLYNTHFIPLAQGRGFSPRLVAWAVALDAAANLCGNLVTGHLADRVRLTTLLGSLYLVRAVGFVLLYFAAGPEALLLYALINGSVEASTIAPTAALCSKIYGPARVGTTFGIVSAFHQFGGAAGAFVVGAIFSRTGSYSAGLVLASGLLLLAAALCRLQTSWRETRAREFDPALDGSSP